MSMLLTIFGLGVVTVLAAAVVAIKIEMDFRKRFKDDK